MQFFILQIFYCARSLYQMEQWFLVTKEQFSHAFLRGITALQVPSTLVFHQVKGQKLFKKTIRCNSCACFQLGRQILSFCTVTIAFSKLQILFQCPHSSLYLSLPISRYFIFIKGSTTFYEAFYENSGHYTSSYDIIKKKKT